MATTTEGKSMKRIPKHEDETRLEKVARNWLNREGENYPEDGAVGAYRDLMHGGCASGMVGELIYYRDTIRFFRLHKSDITAILKEQMEDSGSGPAELFGDKWDASDPLAFDESNQNLLAWFGFEEAARNVANRAGMEDA